jgi:hypothetical protein
LFPYFVTGVVDTGGNYTSETEAKFASGVVDAGGARISLRICEKIRNGPVGILWGWEETDP